MAPDAVLVYADGLAIDPKALMLKRPSAGVADALINNAAVVTADAAALDCPISQTGSLNTAEVYRDGRQPTLGYYLPAYRLGQARADTPPSERYDVRLEFTPSPGEPFVGRLRVRLKGEQRAEVPEPEPTSQTIGFTTFPNGKPIKAPFLLNGNEFAAQGVFLSGAPESPYCAEATRVAVLPAGTYGIPFPFLTTATPNDVNRCNTVLLAAAFPQPVGRVSLTFAGASMPYVLSAYNAQGTVLGRVTHQGELGKTLDIAFVAQGGVSVRRPGSRHGEQRSTAKSSPWATPLAASRSVTPVPSRRSRISPMNGRPRGAALSALECSMVPRSPLRACCGVMSS